MFPTTKGHTSERGTLRCNWPSKQSHERGLWQYLSGEPRGQDLNPWLLPTPSSHLSLLQLFFHTMGIDSLTAFFTFNATMILFLPPPSFATKYENSVEGFMDNSKCFRALRIFRCLLAGFLWPFSHYFTSCVVLFLPCSRLPLCQGLCRYRLRIAKACQKTVDYWEASGDFGAEGV